MDMRLLLLVGLALFAVVGATTLTPLAEATCTTGSVDPSCGIKGGSCEIIELPRCEPYPP